MKKIVSAVLAIAMVCTLFGCSNGATAPKEPTPGTAPGTATDAKTGIRQFEGTTLHIIAEQQNPTIALEKQLGKFEDLTGIKVELEMGPIDSVVQKEMLALQAGNSDYDVISMPYQFLGNLVTNNYIMPIDDLMNDKNLQLVDGFSKDDMITGMMDASGRWKDKLYGVASNTCIMFYAYRKDIFENAEEKAAFKAKYGYDLAVPTNWDQYSDIAEFFTRAKGQKLAGEILASDFYGVTIAGKRHDAMTCEWLNYAWSFGGGLFDKSGNLIINSQENQDALAYFNEMKKYSPPGVSNNTWDEVTAQIQQGIVGMAVTWNDTAPALENKEESKVAGKMGYGAIPVGKASAAHYGAWSYYIPAKAKNPAASWLFLEWFNTPDVQKSISLEGGFPTLQSVYNDPELLKIPYWQGSLEAYKISSVRPRIPEWNEMNNEMMLELSKVIGDEQTPKQALDNLQAKYEVLLKGKLPVSYQ